MGSGHTPPSYHSCMRLPFCPRVSQGRHFSHAPPGASSIWLRQERCQTEKTSFSAPCILQSRAQHMHTPSVHPCRIGLERNDLCRQERMWFIHLSTDSRNLQKGCRHRSRGHRCRLSAKCRGKFEADVDSFDTAVHWWKLTLKTEGMIPSRIWHPHCSISTLSSDGSLEELAQMFETSVATKRGIR